MLSVVYLLLLNKRLSKGRLRAHSPTYEQKQKVKNNIQMIAMMATHAGSESKKQKEFQDKRTMNLGVYEAQMGFLTYVDRVGCERRCDCRQRWKAQPPPCRP